MAAHAKYIGPSSSKRVLLCPASVFASKGIPRDEGGPAAARGTALHALAETCLLSGFENAEDYIGQEVEGRVIDEEDVGLVQPYIDWIRAYGADEEWVELRVGVSGITMEPGGAGTADYVGYKRDAHEWVVADLKTGRSPVSPEENSQLMIYAAGSLMSEHARGKRIDTVRLMIAQELSGGCKEWVTTPKDLWEKIDQWRPVFKRALDLATGDAQAVPEDYQPSYTACQWCPAAKSLKCPARELEVCSILQGEAVTADDFVGFEDLAPDVPSDSEKLGAMWHNLAFVRKFCDDVEAEVTRRTIDGDEALGTKLVPGRAPARKWKENLIASLALVHEELYAPVSVLSVAQAEKARKAGKISDETWRVLESDIHRPDPSLIVVSAKDKKSGAITANDFESF